MAPHNYFRILQFFKWPIVLLIVIWIVACEEEQQQSKPTMERITESVYASLKVRPLDEYAVYSPKPGIIQELSAKEGQKVAKGEPIAKVAGDRAYIELENAQLNLNLAQEKLNGSGNILQDISNQIQAAEIQLEIDSLNYKRYKSLYEQNTATLVQLENSQLKYEIALTQLNNLKNRYAQSELELEKNYNRALNNMELARSHYSDYTIRSEIDGQIYSLNKKNGEFINIQEPLAIIGSREEFVIDMSVDEVDIPNVRIGQKTIITLDAYPSQVFKAEVSKIYPRKDSRTQTYTVEARFIDIPEAIYSGLAGEANIIISQKNNAVTIPLEYLLPGEKVLTSNGEIEVETGMRNMGRIEIVSGLDTSTVIIKP